MSELEPETQPNRRLLMLGLDSVSLPFILENRDKLPTLACLLNEGVLRELKSPASYLSASVWPTFSSGKQPGEHGQYFPFQWASEENRYRRIADPRWSKDFYCQPFWHRVAQAAIRPLPSTSAMRWMTRTRPACRLPIGPIKARVQRRHRIHKFSRISNAVSAGDRSAPKCPYPRPAGNAPRYAIS